MHNRDILINYCPSSSWKFLAYILTNLCTTEGIFRIMACVKFAGQIFLRSGNGFRVIATLPSLPQYNASTVIVGLGMSQTV